MIYSNGKSLNVGELLKSEKKLTFLKIVDKKRKILFLALKFALFCLNNIVKKIVFLVLCDSPGNNTY